MGITFRTRSKGEIHDHDLFCGVVADALARGEAVQMRVRGVSMLPWLRANTRVRIVPAAGRTIRRGDIALFWRKPGRPILHRVVGMRREVGQAIYECYGDADLAVPEDVPASAVMGVVELSAISRWIYLALQAPRRFVNRFFSKRGICLRHG